MKQNPNPRCGEHQCTSGKDEPEVFPVKLLVDDILLEELEHHHGDSTCKRGNRRTPQVTCPNHFRILKNHRQRDARTQQAAHA